MMIQYICEFLIKYDIITKSLIFLTAEFRYVRRPKRLPKTYAKIEVPLNLVQSAS